MASVSRACWDIHPHPPAKPPHPSSPHPPLLLFHLLRSSLRRKRQTITEEDSDQILVFSSLGFWSCAAAASHCRAADGFTQPAAASVFVCEFVRVYEGRAHAHQAAKFTGKNLEWVTSRSGSTREEKMKLKKAQKKNYKPEMLNTVKTNPLEEPKRHKKNFTSCSDELWRH